MYRGKTQRLPRFLREYRGEVPGCPGGVGAYVVVRVIKSLQDPLEVGNNLPGIGDNVRERGLEQKCF